MASKRKIKRYKVSPDESLCLAVSVVDSPAVESDFLFFNEQKMEKFVGVDGERRMIYGCALRSDFPIYRNNGKEEYWLEFDADAIDKLSKNYFKMGFQSNWTAGHKDEVEGLTITESWIKESMTADKSIALGLDPDIAVGSWFIGCYCENDEIWKRVKDGTYNGFSCEALVGLEEFEKQIENNNDNFNDMNEEMLFSKIKKLIADFFKKEDVDTEASEASKITPTEEEIKMEETAPTVEEKPTETPVEEPKVEEPTPTPTVEEKAPEEPKNAPEEKDNHLEELINNLKEEIEALKGVNKDLTSKVKSLEKEPSAKPVNTNAKASKGDTYAQWRAQMKDMLGY